MKMISLDDIIEYCDNERTAYKANSCGAACTALRRVVEFAKEYAIEAEPDNGWISVKDKLPENDGLYIVCKTVMGHQISFEARWKGNKWLSVIKNNQLDYITHWQPLPSTEGLNEA